MYNSFYGFVKGKTQLMSQVTRFCWQVSTQTGSDGPSQEQTGAWGNGGPSLPLAGTDLRKKGDDGRFATPQPPIIS